MSESNNNQGVDAEKSIDMTEVRKGEKGWRRKKGDATL